MEEVMLSFGMVEVLVVKKDSLIIGDFSAMCKFPQITL